MKILLIGNYINDAQESMQRFAEVLKKGLIKEAHEVKLIRPEPFFGKIKPSYYGIGKWLGYIDKFLIFPWKLKKEKKWADIVHICDHSNSFYLEYLKNKKHLVTCNDLLAIRSALQEFKENPSKWTGIQLQKMILNGINKARKVICISEKTKKDILDISKIISKNASVIYMGLNYSYSPMRKKQAAKFLESNVKLPFFIHVGNNNWYKNRMGVLRIFNYLIKDKKMSKFNLVMVGKPFTKEMKEFIRKNRLENKVIEQVGIDNKKLCFFYSTAVALLFPSLQEGFGWPIIEAQACGCPVFTSNRAPMTEVGGDAAIYINPENEKEATETIAKNINKLDNLKQKGFENVKKFTTKKMIDLYIKIYKETLK